MTGPHVIHAPEGTITVAAAVLGRVVVRSAEQADGVRVRRPRRGLDVVVEDAGARVSLELAVPYGSVVPEVAEAVQERVADALGRMCGLEPVAVDVAVEELVD